MHESTQWIAELKAAGWKQYRGMHTTWQAPNGQLFIGPYAAWRVMKRAKALVEEASGLGWVDTEV